MQENSPWAPSPETLAERLAAIRIGQFVGRDAELARWNRFIRVDDEPSLWFIHGPAGIGKTMLLRVFQSDATAAGLDPVYLDARSVEPEPAALYSALGQRVGAGDLARFCRNRRVPVLLVDSFEHWSALACWLRQTFLPGQPANLKIVFAGRKPPCREWQTDPGWQPLLHVSGLPALSERACDAYLWRRHLSPSYRHDLLSLSQGHPLTLAIGADAAQAGQPVPASIADADYSMIRILLDSFTREVDSREKQWALDAAAVARELSESMLAHMLAIDDVGFVFEWLRDLSFIEERPTGIVPHALVRACLIRGMQQHQPGRYEQLAGRAATWFVQRLGGSVGLNWDEAAGMGEDALYALRAAPIVAQFMPPRTQPSLHLDIWRPGDEQAAHALILHQEGEQSLHWFEFWRARVPKAIVVVRDDNQRLSGLFLKLAMETLDTNDRDADPMTRKLWCALQSDFHLHPGDHVPFIRHCVARGEVGGGSPGKNRMLMAIHAYNLTAKNLRLSAQVLPDSQHLAAPAAAFDVRRLQDSETRVGRKTWCIYYNDWECEPPKRYYRRLAERVFGYDQDGQSQGPVSSGDGAAHLDEAAFSQAVADGLDQFDLPGRLSANPLMRSALVKAHMGGTTDAGFYFESLRACFEAALETLAADSATGERQARVLHAAYFASYKNRKAAAAALYMGYSTFRRHLTTAREALTAELWRRERAQR